VRGVIKPPHIANSHSVSVGRRHRPPKTSESQSQKATASSHVAPTTGFRGEANCGSLHQGGSSARPDSRNGAYCSFVTGVRPIAKDRISTPPNRPEGTTTSSGLEIFEELGPTGRCMCES